MTIRVSDLSYALLIHEVNSFFIMKPIFSTWLSIIFIVKCTMFQHKQNFCQLFPPFIEKNCKKNLYEISISPDFSFNEQANHLN